MKINKFKDSFFFKVICFILIFSLLPLGQPRKVQASKIGGHDTYFIETLLSSSGSYEVQVKTDENKMGESLEAKTIKKKSDNDKYVDWSGLSNNTEAYVDFDWESSEKPKLTDKTGLIFSFPSQDRKSSENYNNDYQRAMTVSKTLSSSLNNLLNSIKNSINYSKDSGAEQNIANSIVIIDKLKPSSSDSNWLISDEIAGMKIYYSKASNFKDYLDSGKTQNTSDGVATVDKDGNLLAYIKTGNEKPESSDIGFVWAMPKGYLNPLNGENLTEGTNRWGVLNSNQADEADACWITIFMLSDYAKYQAQVLNNTLITSTYKETNFIETTLLSIVNGFVSGITNLLKLNSIPELIYNQGTRGGKTYEAGMMNSSWWNTVLKYHLIFQIISWMLLIVAIAKILIQVNFSTVNPQLTISIMDTLQKLVVVGFSLALCIPFIRLLATLNNLIVDIFQTQGGSLGFEDIGAGSLGLAGVVVTLGFLGITFTMNCIYVMRAIMIAILTASAPIFITSMAFAGPKQKGLFDNWLKELSANIFMQSIHAFAFAFIFDVMGNSSILVTLVIYFSLLPLVDICRSLIFGQAGGFAVTQGKAAFQSVGAAVEKHVGGLVKGGSNLILSGAAGQMKGSGKFNNMDLNMASPDGGSSIGSGTSGQERESTAGSRLSQNASKIATALKQNGGTGNMIAGTVLNGVSKAADLYKSTGGMMDNSVMKANLGDAAGSVAASKTYGEGTATAIERTGHDAADIVGNAKNYIDSKNLEKSQDSYQKNMQNALESYKDYKAGNEGSLQTRDDYLTRARADRIAGEKIETRMAKRQRSRDGGIRVTEDGRGRQAQFTLDASSVSVDSYGDAWTNMDTAMQIKFYGSTENAQNYYHDGKFNIGQNGAYDKYGHNYAGSLFIPNQTISNSSKKGFSDNLSTNAKPNAYLVRGAEQVKQIAT